MSKRSVFTTITPIPEDIGREIVMSTLRNHVEMIDLNPLVIDRKQVKPPGFSKADEYHAIWYEITDKISYFPGAKGKVSYHGCFNDLPDGLQTHVYAPMGLDIRSRWLIGGNLSHEPAVPRELGLGIPIKGLYLREDVDMRCNVVMTSFVKKTLKKSHGTLVDRLVEKAKIVQVDISNASLHSHYRNSVLGGGAPSIAGSVGSLPGSPHLQNCATAPGGAAAAAAAAGYRLSLSHTPSLASERSDGGFNPALSPGLINDPKYRPNSPSLLGYQDPHTANHLYARSASAEHLPRTDKAPMYAELPSENVQAPTELPG